MTATQEPQTKRRNTKLVREVGLIDSFKTVTPTLARPGPDRLLTYTIHVVNSSPAALSGHRGPAHGNSWNSQMVGPSVDSMMFRRTRWAVTGPSRAVSLSCALPISGRRR